MRTRPLTALHAFLRPEDIPPEAPPITSFTDGTLIIDSIPPFNTAGATTGRWRGEYRPGEFHTGHPRPELLELPRR